MKLVNLRNGAVLAGHVEHALTMGSRLRGLLGRSELPPGQALSIAPCTSIHTFFMRFVIDVAFLDGDGRVLRAISSMKPWRATRIHPRAARAVELPEGVLARSQTIEGDVLREV